MELSKILLITLFAVSSISTWSENRYVGGDVSLLPEYVNAGAKYYDNAGNEVADFLPWCAEQGMNAMRVRLFVNPTRYKETYPSAYDPNACQSLDYILPLCQDIVNAGLDLMLNFHYSDTWADPSAQWTPIEWQDMTDEELYEQIYTYTKEVLISLKEVGVTPAFIQPGNEISYGMLWGEVNTASAKKALMGSSANWDRFGQLLNNAINACREVCPDAKIVIHTERVPNTSVLQNFYQQMAQLDVDYDIIGLSYYPIWHGSITKLNTALNLMESDFPDKDIMIVETGYGLHWQLAGEVTYNVTSTWPISEAGQAKFAQDLVDCLKQHGQCSGLYWWWMEYNPCGTSLSGWYNGPLFDPYNGHATSAFEAICSYAEDDVDGVNTITVAPTEAATTLYFNLKGQEVAADAPGIVIGNGRKRLNRH